MARYQVKTGSTVLVDLPASSNLDGSRKSWRRGTIFRTLGGGTVTQYTDVAVGDERIRFRVPRADGSQRGILASASIGTYGDELTLVSPDYGSISVAFAPGETAYREKKLLPSFGYEIEIEFVRL